MAGLLLRDLTSEVETPWAALYTPLRLMRRSLGEYVKENVEAAKHWVELAAMREAAGPHWRMRTRRELQALTAKVSRQRARLCHRPGSAHRRRAR